MNVNGEIGARSGLALPQYRSRSWIGPRSSRIRRGCAVARVGAVRIPSATEARMARATRAGLSARVVIENRADVLAELRNTVGQFLTVHSVIIERAKGMSPGNAMV